MLPSPTILRHVSGKKKSMATKVMTAMMVRNQKMDLQPSVSERIPPKTGPSDGARTLFKLTLISKEL